LDVFNDVFKQARVSAVMKSGMLSLSFLDCVSVCEGMPNFFPLQPEDSSNGPRGHSFVEFVHQGCSSRGDLVHAK
jgi:hypothetical protein